MIRFSSRYITPLILLPCLILATPTRAGDEKVILSCRGSEKGSYLSKTSGTLMPKDARNITFTVHVTHAGSNVLIQSSGGDQNGSVSGPSELPSDKGWSVSAAYKKDGAAAMQSFLIDRSTGQLTYRYRYESSMGVTTTVVEATCQPADGAKKKF